MEKHTPHCRLPVIRALIEAGKVKTTASALADAANLNIDLEGMISIVKTLTTADFYKSMTTYNNNLVWQDVYRPRTLSGRLYVKLTVIDDVVIVSFKEL